MNGKLQLVLLFLTAAWAAACPTATLYYGDRDGLNGNLYACNLFDPEGLAPQPGEAAGTDTWLKGSYTWELSLQEIGPAVLKRVYLYTMHGGDGLNGPSRVLVNGLPLGCLTDTDEAFDKYGNRAYKDAFDLSPYVDPRADSILLTIQTDPLDEWAVDYLKLKVSYEKITSVVPAPGALLLGASGILLTTWLRRMKGL